MRLAAVVLFGLASVSVAAAQSGPARFPFSPMPNTLPILLFAPDPLAGTMLRPLDEPAQGSPPEIMLEPAAVSLAAVPESAQQPERVLEAVPEPGSEAAAVPEAPAESVPEAAPEPPAEAASGESTVTVIVENVEAATGTVNVAVCDKGLSREGCPFVHEVPAQLGFVETEFQDIPPGNYAIVGYHDVNGNDTFDKTFGMPREPYALSSKAGEKLIPTFEDAALPIKSGENAVIIRLKRLGG